MLCCALESNTTWQINYVPVCANLPLLPPTLGDPMDCSLLISSVHVIHQARILEWDPMPSSGGSSQPRDGTRVF